MISSREAAETLESFQIPKSSASFVFSTSTTTPSSRLRAPRKIDLTLPAAGELKVMDSSLFTDKRGVPTLTASPSCTRLRNL